MRKRSGSRFTSSSTAAHGSPPFRRRDGIIRAVAPAPAARSWLSAAPTGPRGQGGAVGDPEQPGGHGLSLADAAGFAGKSQERRLKRIFRVVVVAQDTAADAEHEALVAADEQLEGGLVAGRGEAAQQLGVADAIGRGLADLMEQSG